MSVCPKRFQRRDTKMSIERTDSLFSLLLNDFKFYFYTLYFKYKIR